MGLTQTAPEVLDYHDRPDEDLVSSAKAGDNLAMEFLLNKYKNFVRIKAKSYFLIGADREDIIQEGMIGLYKAVGISKPTSCRAFAPSLNCASRGRSSPPSRRRRGRSTFR
jgi:RNA polymerase sporulation-specific sigma factor